MDDGTCQIRATRSGQPDLGKRNASPRREARGCVLDSPLARTSLGGQLRDHSRADRLAALADCEPISVGDRNRLQQFDPHRYAVTRHCHLDLSKHRRTAGNVRRAERNNEYNRRERLAAQTTQGFVQQPIEQAPAAPSGQSLNW